MDLAAVTDELYVAPPSDFARRRNELVAAAQRAGDRSSAAAIKKLRKPTLSAWLANLLVHEHKDEIDELLQLGATLRHAQLNLAGPELRQLAQQRREAIGTLVAEARAGARDAGNPVGDGPARELESTLSAALGDESAAEALRSGRLTSALEHTGFALLELTPGSGEPPKSDREASRRPLESNDARSVAEARARQRREAAEAEQTLREAQATASAATRALKDQARELTRLQRERDRRHREVGDLEQRLEEAKSAAAATERGSREAEATHRETEQNAHDADGRVAQAEEALRSSMTRSGDTGGSRSTSVTPKWPPNTSA